MSATVANLDLILDFFQFRVRRKDKMNLIILSDHGVLKSPWETEISSHGKQKDGNQSFFFVFDRNYQASRQPLPWVAEKGDFELLGRVGGEINSFYQGTKVTEHFKDMESYDMAAVFGGLFSGVNVPINSLGNGVSLVKRNSFEIKRFRAVEAQVYEYFASFENDGNEDSRGKIIQFLF